MHVDCSVRKLADVLSSNKWNLALILTMVLGLGLWVWGVNFGMPYPTILTKEPWSCQR